MKHLVVGTGRSGTGWCADTLNTAGVNCGHEAVFNNHSAIQRRRWSWQGFAAESSWLAVPMMARIMNRGDDVRVALVARHPLQVAESMMHVGFDVGRSGGTMGRIYTRFAAIEGGLRPGLDGCLNFWVTWTQRALPWAEAVWRLDDLAETPDVLTQWAGAPRKPARLPPMNTKTDEKAGRPRPSLSWDDADPALADRARDLWESL